MDPAATSPTGSPFPPPQPSTAAPGVPLLPAATPLKVTPPVAHDEVLEATPSATNATIAWETQPQQSIAATEPLRPLLPTRWAHYAILVVAVLAAPAALLGPIAPIALSVLALPLLLIWCGMATANARRAKPAKAYSKPPRPAAAALWWFAAPFVMINGMILAALLRNWADAAPPGEARDTREMAMFAAVGVVIVVGLLCWYRPYGYVARVIEWVGGDGGRARWWFWGPILASFVASIGMFAVGLAVGSGAANDGSAVVAAAMIVTLIALPSLTWLITAHRAMSELETATAMTHAKLQADREQAVPPQPTVNSA
ncbi:MAG: hypothetical protein AAGA42_09185 [Actinomycetota bacterium]